MIRSIATIYAACILLFVSVAPAQAELITGDTFSGVYMFTMKGNDSNQLDALLARMNEWFKVEKGWDNYPDSLRELDKYDDGPSADSIVDLAFPDGNKGGTWTSEVPIEFYAVKGGNSFAVYWLEGGARSGQWSTEHILNGGGSIPDLSHLTVFNPLLTKRLPPVTPTPEPVSIMLFGAGLLGLAALRRFKR